MGPRALEPEPADEAHRVNRRLAQATHRDSPTIDYGVQLIVPVRASPYPLVRETLMLAPGADADRTPEEFGRSLESEHQLKEVTSKGGDVPTECVWNTSLTIQRLTQR